MRVGDLVIYYDGHIPYAEPVLIVGIELEPGGGDNILVMNEDGQHWINNHCLRTIEEWQQISANN